MKIIEKIKDLNENIDKSQKEMKLKKEEFNREWNKWGKKREMPRRIP